jgi:hypothetical protein
MRFSSLGAFALLTCGAIALATSTGCEENNKNDSGRVMDRNQTQHTNPDGSQVRERTQVRQTPDGQTVKETETQKREPVSPQSTTAQ